MANSILHEFVNHPRRNVGVGIAAATIGFLFGLPAWEDLSSAHSRETELSTKLTEVKNSVQNLDQLKDRVESISSTENSEETITAEAAIKIRQTVVEIIRKHRCGLTRVSLSDPFSRAWGKDDKPLSISEPDKKNTTDMALVSRRLNLVVSGTLPSLSKVIEDSSSVHPLAVPTKMTIRHSGVSEDLSLELELTLLRLERAEKKKKR